MDEKNERRALNSFKKATHLLFNEKLDDAYFALVRLISMYPETFIAHKSRLLMCIICKTKLYSECLITEAFSKGIKALEVNPILDLFNKERKYFVDKYEIHAAKRMRAFGDLKNVLSDLLVQESKWDYPIAYMYINLSAERLKGCDPLKDLDEIRYGKIYTEEQLQRVIRDVYYYIFVTTLSDDFDIEYTDKLSSLSKHKINRIDLYHSSMSWLKKFYRIQQQFETGELIRKCCVIVLALTKESSDRKRQDAYETLSGMSKDYYTMAVTKEDFVETKVRDIEEEIFEPQIAVKNLKVESLMDLVCLDEKSQSCEVYHSYGDATSLALEINIEPSIEIEKAKEELSGTKGAPVEEEGFASKLEFE